jgi:hypothetical protein
MYERGGAPRQSAINYYGEGYRQVLSRLAAAMQASPYLASDEDVVGEKKRAALCEALLRADGTLGYTGHYRDRSLHARGPFFRIER